MRVSTIALLSLFLLSACGDWSRANVEETERRGDIVAAALKNYRDRTGSYPDTLQKLVPQDLNRIPQPTVGKREWEYETWPTKDGRGYFGLKVAIRFQSKPLLQTNNEGGWSFDTK